MASTLKKPRLVTRSLRGSASLSIHPGAVHDIEQEMFNKTMLQYVTGLTDTSQVFNFHSYAKIRRSK